APNQQPPGQQPRYRKHLRTPTQVFQLWCSTSSSPSNGFWAPNTSKKRSRRNESPPLPPSVASSLFASVLSKPNHICEWTRQLSALLACHIRRRSDRRRR